jgi:hypothetical protein
MKKVFEVMLIMGLSIFIHSCTTDSQATDGKNETDTAATNRLCNQCPCNGYKDANGDKVCDNQRADEPSMNCDHHSDDHELLAK